MATNTSVKSRWSKRLSIALIILGLGLIVSYILIVPAPAINQPLPGIGNEYTVPGAIPNAQRGWDAYAARYTAMAEAYAASNSGTQRGLDAYAARYTAMADAYAAKEAANIKRGWDACAARYTAMAKQYLNK